MTTIAAQTGLAVAADLGATDRAVVHRNGQAAAQPIVLPELATYLHSLLAAASATVAGKVELATIAEIDTGTDDLRAITPAGLAGSALAAAVAAAISALSGIEAGADVTDQANVEAALASSVLNGAGKQTIWVPAAAMTPTVSNGCGEMVAVETTAGQPDLQVLDFDATADEHAQFSIAFPKSWALGTVTFQVWWTTAATDTDGVAWGLQAVAQSDGDAIAAAYGTAIVVTDVGQSTANDVYVTAESSAITIAGTPADDDIVHFRLFRDVSDAADTMAEDARLLGVKVFFTTDAARDN